MRRSAILWLILALAACVHAAQARERPTVLLVSVDGLMPGQVLEADRHGLRIPHLRALLTEGAHARGVVGILPTQTFPSHTTLVTGAAPARHGILNNAPFDPEGRNAGGWYWYHEDIRTATLWSAAREAGLTTAVVGWPVTVGAPVDLLIPSIWRAGTDDDAKLMRAVSTPGLVASLQETLDPYPIGSPTPASDAIRADYAIAILQRQRPDLLALHLGGLDGAAHAHGPFSAEARAALETLDGLLGRLRAALLDVDPEGLLFVVSDHGFRTAERQLNLRRALADAGLLRETPTGAIAADWEAAPWNAAGTAAIVLRRPQDAALAARVGDWLRGLAADPANGIAEVLDADQAAVRGGYPGAAFVLAMQPSWAATDAPGLPLHSPIVAAQGKHGYLPDDPALHAALFAAGAGIAAGRDLGIVDMRGIAPTIAAVLGLRLEDAEMPALEHLWEGPAPR